MQNLVARGLCTLAWAACIIHLQVAAPATTKTIATFSEHQTLLSDIGTLISRVVLLIKTLGEKISAGLSATEEAVELATVSGANKL